MKGNNSAYAYEPVSRYLARADEQVYEVSIQSSSVLSLLVPLPYVSSFLPKTSSCVHRERQGKGVWVVGSIHLVVEIRATPSVSHREQQAMLCVMALASDYCH